MLILLLYTRYFFVAHYFLGVSSLGGSVLFFANIYLLFRFRYLMLPMDISAMFVSGMLNYSTVTAVSSASFTFQNIHEELLKRTRSPVAPNVILELYFSLGSSQEISLGRWHIDRASTDIPGNQITVSARNTIGKLLKERITASAIILLGKISYLKLSGIISHI